MAQVCATRSADTYGASALRGATARTVWVAPFRILTAGGDYFLGVYLVVSGFLVSFVLFLRSGPLLQQAHASERGRASAFAGLSVNFLAGRWLRIWPTLQVPGPALLYD